MKQMTDKEIIKTAECCLQAKTREDCHDLRCPCDSIYSCMFFDRSDDESDFAVPYEIIKELLGVINRQQEQLEAAIAGQETLQKVLANKDREVAELNSDLKLLKNNHEHLKTNFDETIEKNKRLRDKVVGLTAEKDQLIKSFGECQAEAVKDFSKAVIDGIDEGYISHSSDIVDFTNDYLSGKMAGDTE